jgi:2-phospho-L-lactate guanylyltransferase
MLRDTIAAVAATTVVHHLMVLWDQEGDRGAVPTVDGFSVGGLGLNASLEAGSAEARRRFPHLDVVVVPGDLPALDPRELEVCLARAALAPRAHLADAEGTGTTVLTATGGRPLLPAYGAGSAAAHAETGASPLNVTGVQSVRYDVDNLESLARAMDLGCGRHTLECCASLGLTPAAVR